MEFRFKVHLGMAMWFLRQYSSSSNIIRMHFDILDGGDSSALLSLPPVFQANWTSLFLKVTVLSSTSEHLRRSLPYSGKILILLTPSDTQITLPHMLLLLLNIISPVKPDISSCILGSCTMIDPQSSVVIDLCFMSSINAYTGNE